MRRIFYITCFALLIWLSGISALHLTLNARSVDDGDTVKLGYMPILDHLACMLLQDRQILAANAQEVDAVRFSAWPEVADAFRSGHIDAAVLLVPQALALYAQGVPLKIIGLVQRNGSSLVVSQKHAINTIADLEGKTIAINSRYSAQYLRLRQICNDNGISGTAISFIEMPPPEMPSALMSGQIDGFICGEPYPAASELRGDGKIFLYGHDLSSDFISNVLVIREDKVSAEQAAIIKEHINNVNLWIDQNRLDAAGKASKTLHMDKALMEFALTVPLERQRYDHLLLTDADVKFLQAMANEMTKIGLLKITLNVNNIISGSPI